MPQPVVYTKKKRYEQLGGARLRELASGFGFAESPLWHPDGFILLSDLKANRILRVGSGGAVDCYFREAGDQENYFTGYHSEMTGPNGLALDDEMALVFCSHGKHAVSKLDAKGRMVHLCTSYNGRPFNSPNDLVIRTDGAIFFTDPPYGLKGERFNEEIFQPHGGIYCYHRNAVMLLGTDLKYPNGICFSTDERFLYVSSNRPEEACIYRYSLSAAAEIISRRTLAAVNADGIKTDALDNIFAATDKGVLVLSPGGTEIALIPSDEPLTNLCFGGPRNTTLFVTSYHALYTVELDYLQYR